MIQCLWALLSKPSGIGKGKQPAQRSSTIFAMLGVVIEKVVLTKSATPWRI
jgi:hypothetical protein